MNCLNKNVNPDFGFAKRAADFIVSAIVMTRSTGTTRTNTKICQLSVVSCQLHNARQPRASVDHTGGHSPPV